MTALGQIASGKDFFDRKAERQTLWKTLSEGNHAVIFAPRRIGKSSLVKKMVEETADPGDCAQLCAGQLIDLGGCSSVPEVLATIAHAFPEPWLEDLARKVPWLAGTINRLVAWVPTVSLNIPSIADRRSDEERWYQDALALQERLSCLPILIGLDEFSVFLERLLEKNRAEGEKFLGWLRAWRQEAPKCRFIFSGSVGIRSLLARYKLSDAFDDCAEFELPPFTRKMALEMLGQLSSREGNLKPTENVLAYLCDRTGWLSPFFLNLFFNEAQRAAQERINETMPESQLLQHCDLDLAYQRLVSKNGRFLHWYERLEKYLQKPDLGMAKAILRSVARAEDGVTRRQLLNRLAKLESDREIRRERMNEILIYLHENGYLNREEPVRFLSFLLRDYWKTNHAF
jgi:AAA+ ATPase superfamily predicted ATPase